MAESKVPRWLIGCGIGCGAIVLIGIVLVIASTLWIRDTVKGFDSAVEARQELEDRFGTVGGFTPRTDGSIPPDRMEAFLTVRDATQPSRLKIAEAIALLPTSDDEARELDSKSAAEKTGAIFTIVKGALGLPGELGEFFEARNRSMLDAGIGLGEYSYIYAVAYHAWLGHPPSDGPAGDEVRLDSTGDTSTDRSLPRVRRSLLKMLRNQRAALVEELGPDASDPWLDELTAEIEVLRSDRDRVPWQDGVPEPIAVSLEPYRQRLEATYAPETNPFELARNRKRGMSIQAE